MTTNIGGRPRNPDVETEEGDCPTHGRVELRIHKVGKSKAGKQRYKKRCPQCHTIGNGGTGEGIPID